MNIIDYRIHSRYANNITTKSNIDLDIALLKFDRPIGKGRSLNLVIASDQELNGREIESAGYPHDKI